MVPTVRRTQRKPVKKRRVPPRRRIQGKRVKRTQGTQSMVNALKELAHSGARDVKKQVKKATRRVVTHGKRQLKASTAELVKTTAADLVKHVP